MSDYIAMARTNYFRVRDVEALKLDLRRHGITPSNWDGRNRGADFVLDDSASNKPDGSIALFCEGPWPYFDGDMIVDSLESDGTFEQLWPGVGETDAFEPQYTFLWELVAAHLIEEEVAVFKESGHQKLAYIGGSALAVNSRGETESIDLDDIYEITAKLGRNPVTRADS